MPAYFPRPGTLALIFSSCLIVGAFASWEDKSAGRPVLENFLAREFGPDETQWIVLQDKIGRLYVGGDRLQVFDGQSWQSFPVPNSYALRALALGSDGRVWAGAVNEAGYFEESSLGVFQYHSLLGNLPPENRLIGDVWACGQVDEMVYFICRDKLLRWDGQTLQVQPYPGKSRLFPLRVGQELWFQHLETGLYRLTAAGPKLEIPAAALPPTGLLGLAKDEDGWLFISGHGFYRPGAPARQVFSDEANRYIRDSKLASYALLPDGKHAVGTLGGGMAIIGRSGELLRILDAGDGLPSRAILYLSANGDGRVWGATASGIFNFEASGRATLFDALTGLKGKPTKLIQPPSGGLFALTVEGSFQLQTTPDHGGRFQRLPRLAEIYYDLLSVRDGLLLSRQGGLDLFDGTTVKSLFSIPARSVFFATPARSEPDVYFLSEGRGVSRWTMPQTGPAVHSRLVDLPDICSSIFEDATGRLWLGTVSKGAFTYDPKSDELTPVNDPASGHPLAGSVALRGDSPGILLWTENRMLQARPDEPGVALVPGVPSFQTIATVPIPHTSEMLVAFRRSRSTDSLTEGLGVLALDAAGRGTWRDLALPDLRSTGFVTALEFSEESGRRILWIGGTEGVLRVDYQTVSGAQPPETPFIRLDATRAGRLPGEPGFSFPFHGHLINFRVFTSDHAHSKDWLFQSRLGNGTGEWTDAAPRRLFEYTNLSEGDYRFEVRAVNASGLTSEPAVFAFRILPPWYRSTGAYAGYVTVLALAGFAFVRVRERRIRARNQELEALVDVRTAELIKASAAKDEFLAGISHEIRNPMNGVIGIADNFKTEGLDPESRRKFGLLRQCATHLSSLLEDILDFSRVQAGAVDIEAKPFDLTELMESIVAMTAADSEKRHIPIEIAISPAVPRHLIGDPKRIRQILLNFTSNALKFSGRGKVSVTVWCKALGPERTEVIFAVSDEGPGISPEEQKRLFTRFERGAAAQQGRVPGTGLGLALCKGLAEKMGGRIWLESEPGQGSCFSFSATFPIAVAPAEAASIPPLPAPAQLKTALVVDDQEYNRVVLIDLLETLGYKAQGAAEGTTALAFAASTPCDVVLLDFNLPGLSGLDVTHGIRALPNASAKAFILATTAFSTPEKRAQCLAAGMNAFLGKPVTMERLRKALADAPTSAPAPAPAVAAPDGLANLRLLARKKNTPFADELALYLSEFQLELEYLSTALRLENAADAGHYAHLLYGRCAFIAERALEQTLRKIEEVSATAQWEEGRALGREVETQLAALRVRLATAGGPVAPPASVR